MVAASEPPMDIKNIIKKTVEFYVKHGDSFIEKIREKEKNNVKFNFLKAGDQYHQYYINIRETELQKQPAKPIAKPVAKPSPTTSTSTPPPPAAAATTEPTTTTPTTDNAAVSTPPPPPLPSTSTAASIATPTTPPPPPPPAEPPKKEIYEPVPLLYILDTPEEVTAVDLDTMRLTAQYVAVNGDSFQQGLALREARNIQFDFLKPTHHLHSWYRALVESYAAIVFPPKNICDMLDSSDFTDKQKIVERSINRFEWNQKEQVAAKKAEEEADQERAMIASIDWHDFVVVETIDFTNDNLDLLPSPKTFDELLKLSEEQWTSEENADGGEGEMDVDMDMEDMDMETEDKEADTSASTAARPKLKVVKDYTKTKPSAVVGALEPKKITQPCPMCGQEIPLEEMQEHMRIELLNKKEKPKQPAFSTASTVLHDDEISRNLQSFANRRTDIFTPSGDQDMDDENNAAADKVIWDGHTSSISRTQQHALQIAQERIQKQQMQQRQQQPPIPPPPHLGAPNQMYIPQQQQPPPPPFGSHPPPPLPPSFMNQPPPPPLPGLVDTSTLSNIEQQPTKKQKTEDTLISEEEFIQANPGPITLTIESTAGSDGSTQNYSLTLQPKDTITILKEKIKDLIGLAPNKQKLKSPGQSILKDQFTLAYYNLLSGTIVNVSTKERGGRKK